jgi:flagellar basal-body rod protein FlgF
VLDAAAARSSIDPLKGPVIGEDGTISQGAELVGKIALARSTTSGQLSKDGDNLYRNTSNDTPRPPRTPRSARACWRPPTSIR